MERVQQIENEPLVIASQTNVVVFVFIFLLLLF